MAILAMPGHGQDARAFEFLHFVCELRLRQAPDSRRLKEERFGDHTSK